MRGVKTRKDFKKGSLFEKVLSKEEGLEWKDEIVFADGSCYKGQVKYGDVRHGFGVQVWPDGSKYQGLWASGMA
jgi:hypothetical protein